MTTNNALNITEIGIVANDGAGTFSGREITGTASFIDIADGTGVSGNPTASIGSDFESTGMHGWNGSLIETASVVVTSDGAVITCSVEKSGGGNLTAVFSDGYYNWTTAPDTISLTAGTDEVFETNYVYFLQSTKVLTVNTSAWPSAEHVPLATVICQSAASLQTDGGMKVHLWTDHITSTINQGHILDLSTWVRNQNATWMAGVLQSYTITQNGGSADNVILETTAGTIFQLHPHTFPSFTGTPDIYVVNDPVSPFKKITDLNEALTDSNGVSMSGRFFSLVAVGVVSEDTGDSKLFLNLPSGSYNNTTGVENDLDNFANFTFPTDFKGTNFLISEWKLSHKSANNGTWLSVQEIDLRGVPPSSGPSGVTATPNEFDDSVFRIFDDGDDTKKISFQADQITTATTRTITMLDADLDLADVVQGPASATDDAIARFDGTTGKLIQNSVGILTDAGALSGLTLLDVDNLRLDGNTLSSTDTNGNVNLTPNGTGRVDVNRSLSAGTVQVFISNNDGTAATDSSANLAIATIATSVGDPSVTVSIAAARSYCFGIDNDDDDILKINTLAAGGVRPSTGTNLWNMTAAGERTMPLQPCFLATGAGGTDVTGDGTIEVIGSTVAWTQIVDPGGDFNVNGTFTSPVSANYQIQGAVLMTGIVAGMTVGQMHLNASNRLLGASFGDPSAVVDPNENVGFIITSLIDMDAGDTVTSRIQISNGTKTADINNGFPGNVSFSGYLFA